MEESDSASSVLRKSNSFKNRPSSDPDAPPPTGSSERATMLAEVYGFMGSITAAVAAGSIAAALSIFIVWAYVPEYWLQHMGINYYPNRYWELGVPSYVSVMIVVAIVIYTGINFLATPPPTSLKLIFDEYGEDLLNGIPLTENGEPLSEICSDQVSQLFNDLYS